MSLAPQSVRYRVRVVPVAICGTLFIAALLAITQPVTGTFRAADATPAAGCADATPLPDRPLATPSPAVSPSPASASTPCSHQGEPADFGTPVVVDDLSVTILSDKTTAGPRAITAVIRDASGAPVNDASIVIRAHSLEMNMGETTSEAIATGDGRYLADPLNMGMGGEWQVEIEVTLPGSDPVVFTFNVSLEGPD